MSGRGIARSVLASAAIGVAVVAVTGCGSSTVSNTLDPVAQAATQSTSAPGFRMTMTMNLASSQLPSAITATGSGAFQTSNHVGSMTMAMSLGSLASIPQVQQVLGGSTLNIAEVLDHSTIYMKMPSALMKQLGGAGKPWLKLDLAKLGASNGLPGLGALANNPASSDPSQMLGYLRGASGQLRNLGKAMVSGVETTHYSATIDLDKVAARYPPSERQAIQQTIKTLESEAGLSSIPVDVWIDKQHLVRRMQMAYKEQLAAIGQMHLAMTMNFTDYGPQPAPTVPPASQVSDLSSLAGSGSTGI